MDYLKFISPVDSSVLEALGVYAPEVLPRYNSRPASSYDAFSIRPGYHIQRPKPTLDAVQAGLIRGAPYHPRPEEIPSNEEASEEQTLEKSLKKRKRCFFWLIAILEIISFASAVAAGTHIGIVYKGAYGAVVFLGVALLGMLMIDYYLVRPKCAFQQRFARKSKRIPPD